MKLLPLAPSGHKAGLTLTELSVIIVVLIFFVSLSFIGINAWKRGSDRAQCLANIRQVQQAVRGYSNLYSLRPGDHTGRISTAIDLEEELIGTGKHVTPPPSCPGRGDYRLGGNQIPVLGELYMTCSLSNSQQHVPQDYTGW